MRPNPDPDFDPGCWVHDFVGAPLELVASVDPLAPLDEELDVEPPDAPDELLGAFAPLLLLSSADEHAASTATPTRRRRRCAIGILERALSLPPFNQSNRTRVRRRHRGGSGRTIPYGSGMNVPR
jgi:hypothetical protein